MASKAKETREPLPVSAGAVKAPAEDSANGEAEFPANRNEYRNQADGFFK
jgi:hypothetical protein